VIEWATLGSLSLADSWLLSLAGEDRFLMICSLCACVPERSHVTRSESPERELPCSCTLGACQALPGRSSCCCWADAKHASRGLPGRPDTHRTSLVAAELPHLHAKRCLGCHSCTQHVPGGQMAKAFLRKGFVDRGTVGARGRPAEGSAGPPQQRRS